MRLLRGALAVLLGLVVLVAAGVGGALWWSLPGGHEALRLPGLSAPARVAFDADGIPHITAANDEDAAAALGYVHARDRMFQMEMMRRNASGRLSEIAGGLTLPLDRAMRTFGLRRRAEAELAGLEPATRAVLEAYARGVNAWIGARGRFASVETIVLGAPEPWTPVDSLLWGKTMGMYLSSNWRRELANAALVGRLTPDQVRALWPRQEGAAGPAASLGPGAARVAGLVPAFPAPFTQPERASNEWAVDGAHSQTGAPLLAGDPHLAFSMPGIWYLARIETPRGVLAGATAPGVPFLVLGHNGRIAWSFTSAEADTQDVFIETVLPDGSYATPEGPKPFEVHEERIRVRGGADEVLRVRETRHGPVISDLDRLGGGAGGPVLAVAMANLAPGDTAAQGLLALNRAGTVAEAGRAAAAISAPVQNMLVADRGHIGMFTTGRVPVRRAGDGVLPVAGADGGHDWVGFASGEALPHQVDPASGRLVNANERVMGADSPVFMGADWFGDWRARRIRALLGERSTHSVASFAAMQVDSVSAFAQAMLPRLLAVPAADPASRAGLAALGRWDGAMRAELAQPLLFNDWMRRFGAALERRAGVPTGVLGATPDAIARALGPEAATWCGDACDAMLTTTLAEASADYEADLRWGDVHQAEFQHPLLGRIPGVGQWFTWRVEQPGDDTTLFRGATQGPGWTSVHGPSFRGVYDLADLDRSVFSVAPGQSGHVLRHAGGLLGRWRGGASLRMGADVRAVETIALDP